MTTPPDWLLVHRQLERQQNDTAMAEAPRDAPMAEAPRANQPRAALTSKRVNKNVRHEAEPVGKRLKPEIKTCEGWGPFDDDGFRLDATA